MKSNIINNQTSKKLLAVIMCAAMTLTSFVGCKSNEEPVEEPVEQTEEDLLESVIEDHMGIHTETETGEMVKDETVYVIADANGNTNEILVSDWLKNAKAEGGLNDVSGLTDIENTSSGEICTEDGNGNLYWSANGNDIHYKGKSDKELPVDITVTYFLNGVETSPEDIAGKNGDVKIRFDYKNNQRTTIEVGGKEEEIYVPFAMISGVILDSSKFSNITVSSGRVISEAGKNIVVGIAFPGLEESLDINGMKDKANELGVDAERQEELDDFEIPDYVEITAHTVGFEIGQTMTIAATDVLSALDSTTDKINTDNFKSSLADLSDGMSQLSDGSVQLSAGAQELMEGARTLSEKSQELDDGAKKLDDGARELDSGAGELRDGAQKLDEGTGELVNGTVALSDGTKSLVDGVGTLKDGTQALKAGTEALKAGFEGPDGAIYGAQQIADGAGMLNTAVLGAEAPSLTDEQKAMIQSMGADGASGYAGTFAQGIVYGDGTNPGLVDSLVSTVVNNVFDGIGANIANSKADTVSGVSNAAGASIEEQIQNGEGAGYSLYMALQAAGKTPEEAAYAVEAFASGVAENAASQVIDGMGTKIDSSRESTISAISEGAKPMVESLLTEGLKGPLSQLGGGIALQVANSVMEQVSAKIVSTMSELGNATTQLAEGTKKLVDGLVQLYSGTTQVDDGVGELTAGVDTLQDGAYSLNNGACALKNGAIELKSGSAQLFEGTVNLKDGTFSLVDGTSKLFDGTTQFMDGTSKLYDGTKELSDGTIELMDGVMKFDEEGISKLTDLFGEDVDNVVERIEAVIDAGSTYKIYTDVAEGVDSSVKFIYKTDGIKAE